MSDIEFILNARCATNKRKFTPDSLLPKKDHDSPPKMCNTSVPIIPSFQVLSGKHSPNILRPTSSPIVPGVSVLRDMLGNKFNDEKVIHLTFKRGIQSKE